MAAAPSTGGPSASLDVMDIVRTAGQLLQRKVGALLGLQALGVVPGTLVILIGVGMSMPSFVPGQAPPTNPADVFGDSLVPLIVSYVIGLIVILGSAAVVYPASFHVALETFRGNSSVTFAQGIAKGMQKAPTMLAAIGIVIAAELVAFAVIGGAFFALRAVSEGAAIIGVVVLVLALLIAVTVIYLQMTAFVPSIVAEDLDIASAFRRSTELMSGNKFSMFLAYVVMTIGAFAVFIPLACCVGGPLSAIGAASGSPTAGSVLMQVVFLPANLALTVWMYIAAPVVAYARRSGWGSAVAAQDVAQVFR